MLPPTPAPAKPNQKGMVVWRVKWTTIAWGINELLQERWLVKWVLVSLLDVYRDYFCKKPTLWTHTKQLPLPQLKRSFTSLHKSIYTKDQNWLSVQWHHITHILPERSWRQLHTQVTWACEALSSDTAQRCPVCNSNSCAWATEHKIVKFLLLFQLQVTKYHHFLPKLKNNHRR